MTSPALPLDAPRPRFALGRVGEFLVVGGLTPFLFLLSWVCRRSFRLDPAEYAIGFLMFHAAFVVNDPHFTVTYLLFYRDMRARAFGGALVGAQRARYLLAGFVAPLVLFGWGAYALATGSSWALSMLIRLMFFLVGWHYVKQGFGVFSTLSARRGVRFDGKERLAILAHCFSGWAYAWSSPVDPGREVEEKGVVYTTMRDPTWLEPVTFALAIGTALVMFALLARKWRRDGHLPIGTPLVALLCSIWPWSIYAGIDPLVRYVIPALHSVQYLYFVWLLRGNEAREREGPPHFERSARVRVGILAVTAIGLGIVLFHGLPSALDEALGPRGGITTEAIGPTPFFAAMFAFLNIHHYLMDAVIWRRENPETRYLRA